MKYTLITLAAFLIACETTVKKTKTGQQYHGNDIEIIEIEGCEYIKIHTGYQGYFAHKGNCKNH